MCVVLFAVPGPPAAAADGGFNMMMFMMAWVLIALVLFLLRPSSLRRNRGDQKPSPGQVGNQVVLMCLIWIAKESVGEEGSLASTGISHIVSNFQFLSVWTTYFAFALVGRIISSTKVEKIFQCPSFSRLNVA